MNQRERVLAIATGFVVVAIMVFFGYRRIEEGFKKKDKDIAELKRKVQKNDDIMFEGSKASANIRKITPKSLPSEPSRASTDYRSWLTKLAEEMNLGGAKLELLSKKDEKGLFFYQDFKIEAVGDLEQLIALVYRIHEKDYLHRISSINLTPVKNDPYAMRMTIRTEAMSLLSAAKNQPVPTTLSNRVSKTLDEYAAVILNRNVFAPENKPPMLKASNAASVAKGEVLKYEVGAKDAENTFIDYAIIGDPPKGMKIDERSGVVNWEPKEMGTYEVRIAARDRGIPRKTSEQLLKITVVEPKPPAPVKEEKKFDIATQAVVTAFLAGGKDPQVWINSRIEDKTHYLKIGDELALGSIKGKLVKIGANYAEFETEGKRWVVGDTDKNLADAFKRIED